MTKQEKIQEAYGDYFEKMKPWINENGWFDKNAFYIQRFFFKCQDLDMFFCHRGEFMIPVTIKNIEENNGWVKLNSEEDLPKTDKTIDLWFLTKTGHITINIWNSKFKHRTYGYLKVYSHFQIVIQPELPVY